MEEFLIEKLKSIYCEYDIKRIIEGLKIHKKTSFRVNFIKSSISEIKNILDDNNIAYDVSDEYDSAFYTDADIRNLDIYKSGKIYIQSISSMKPVYVLDPKESENILDMCAAPGSKTTLIQSLTSNKTNLTACELHKDRFERLKYNVNLQGANVYLLNQNAIDLNDMLKFDKILLDAPCTGSGTIDLNNPKYNFSNMLLSKCVKTQKNLISKSSKLLKSGKILVYSTCSLLKEENEDIIDFALSKDFMLIEKVKEFPDSKHEGFFIAKLIKV